MMDDLISRQAAVELAMKYCPDDDGAVQCDGDIRGLLDELENLPPAQPEPSEITDEQAILHLQSTGWMQNHDREMYESGLREQLADDSGGYDSLIPCEDTISRQAAIDAVDAIGHIATMPDGDKCIRRSAVKYTLSMLPPTQPEYEPVTAEDFAKTMSETSVYSYMLWHSEALTLMKKQGFVICKKTM